MKAALSSGERLDAVLKRAQVSEKVFSIFYDLPVGHVTSGAVASVVGSNAAALLLTQKAASDGQQPSEAGPPQQLLLTDGESGADIDR